MNPETLERSALSEAENAVRALYFELLERWNARDAARFAALFAENGTVVGFDGSQHIGRSQIAADLARIFGEFPTASFVGKVKEVRFLAPPVAIVRAAAGMVPPDEKDINPAVNAIQSLVVRQSEDRWEIAHFHNTPAAFHGRPQLAEELTAELREVLRKSAPAR